MPLPFLIGLVVVCLWGAELAPFQDGTGPGIIEWDLAQMNDSARTGVTKSGDPKTIQAPFGHAVLFDGTQDGLFLDHSPLIGLSSFTLEVLFRPDSGGMPEQRFLHMGEMNRDRVMMETRLTAENNWYLDAHVRSGDSALTLIDKEKQHAAGEWYHLAFVVRDGLMETFVNGNPELRGGIPFRAFKSGNTSLGVRQNRKYWFKGAIGRIRITATCLEPQNFMKWK